MSLRRIAPFVLIGLACDGATQKPVKPDAFQTTVLEKREVGNREEWELIVTAQTRGESSTNIVGHVVPSGSTQVLEGEVVVGDVPLGVVEDGIWRPADCWTPRPVPGPHDLCGHRASPDTILLSTPDNSGPPTFTIAWTIDPSRSGEAEIGLTGGSVMSGGETIGAVFSGAETVDRARIFSAALPRTLETFQSTSLLFRLPGPPNAQVILIESQAAPRGRVLVWLHAPNASELMFYCRVPTVDTGDQFDAIETRVEGMRLVADLPAGCFYQPEEGHPYTAKVVVAPLPFDGASASHASQASQPPQSHICPVPGGCDLSGGRGFSDTPVDHPIKKTQERHLGNDYVTRDANGDPDDVPIRASADGVVIRRDRTNTKGYGRVIYVSHDGGWVSVYGHLSAFNVELGDLVTQGETIGRAGDDGGADGIHLHYELVHQPGEIRRGEDRVDPTPIVVQLRTVALTIAFEANPDWYLLGNLYWDGNLLGHFDDEQFREFLIDATQGPHELAIYAPVNPGFGLIYVATLGAKYTLWDGIYWTWNDVDFPDGPDDGSAFYFERHYTRSLLWNETACPLTCATDVYTVWVP